MSQLLEALDKLAQQSWNKNWQNPAIRQFVESGDERLLGSIPKLDHAWGLDSALPVPSSWTVEAGRLLQLAVRDDIQGVYSNWLGRYCRYSNAVWSEFQPAIDLLRTAGATEKQIFETVGSGNLWNDAANELTPAGRSLLAVGDDLLRHVIEQTWHESAIVFVLARHQPGRLVQMLDAGLKLKHPASSHLQMLRADPIRFHKRTFAVSKGLTDEHERATVAHALLKADPVTYRDWALREIKSVYERPVEDHVRRTCCEFLIDAKDPDAFAITRQWMATFNYPKNWNAAFQRELVLKDLVSTHPDEVIPTAECATQCPAGNAALLGLRYWKQQGIGDTAGRYHAALQRVLANADAGTVVSGISEAAGWNLSAAQEDLWPLMQHKSRPVRGAAARALAGLGQELAGERATGLLEHKKSDVRLASVTLLEHLGTSDAIGALKARLDSEESDDVRDAILLALERKGGGAAMSQDEIAARIAKTLAKTKSSPVPWLDPALLILKRRDGSSLKSEEVLYLLIRQSRCKEMRADLEAKPLYATLDRAASGAAAVSALQAFLGSEQSADDRWVMAFAALTGDDRIVPVLHRALIDWADKSRGKLAEYGAQALALLGTDAALMVVESLSVRFRSKNKNVGKAAGEAFASAAEARGVTVEELGDLVVPWLGFEPSKPRIVTAGKAQIEVRISNDFKVSFRDVASGKKIAKLPSAAAAALQAEFKELAATLKEAVKAQLLRVETLLVRQFRWPAARWRELYQAHPLLRPFTERLVWSWRGDDGRISHTFRALDDGSLTDAKDNAVVLPEGGTIALVHPLELDEVERGAWLKHLADYDVMPPFSQLDRPVVQVREEERGTRFGKSVAGTQVNAMSFRGRAEKLGWTRGSVGDAGGVSGYRKVFSGAAVEAFLNLEGMYVAISMDETIALGDVFFVRTGTVQTGSYTYDEPHKEDDPRLIAFGDVPAVPFSETMGDLAKISGKALGQEAATASENV